MKITYVHHSAFLVELEHVNLVFDYTLGELLQLSKDKPLMIFASHRHGDHYDPAIFELGKEYNSVRYILANDIRRKHLPQEVLEFADTVKHSQKLGYVIENGKIEQSVQGSLPAGALKRDETVGKCELWITTLRSTDEGVAFLIETEGKTLYHGGDLNNWTWPGEAPDWNGRMSERYSSQIKRLEGTHLDVAFLPLDPRQESAFYLGIDEFLRRVDTDHGFPMHFWGDFSVIGKLKAMECSVDYRDRIVDIHRDGEIFIL